MKPYIGASVTSEKVILYFVVMSKGGPPSPLHQRDEVFHEVLVITSLITASIKRTSQLREFRYSGTSLLGKLVGNLSCDAARAALVGAARQKHEIRVC